MLIHEINKYGESSDVLVDMASSTPQRHQGVVATVGTRLQIPDQPKSLSLLFYHSCGFQAVHRRV